MAVSLVILLLRLYRWTLSPLLASIAGPDGGCRFVPSCSRYAEEAVKQHGVWRGGHFTVKRLCRCHPWGGSGLDLVPPVKAGGLND